MSHLHFARAGRPSHDSTVMRVMVNFIMKAAKHSNNRVFKTEDEALSWLDQVVS